eukprot:TRINITY_DN2490_c0_g1_i1.p1 TRINITY_DN2490_c0_g1~~TRINITY_DN2490_c0_g1_i1.p1  ORF type:complete len:891 (-),score=205.68 TRINITY_DN2490_c0_g1_i1:137-2809(-)
MGAGNSQEEEEDVDDGRFNPYYEQQSGEMGHAMYIIDNPGKINDFYFVEKERIGEGSFARITKAWNRSTGAERACKSATKDLFSQKKNDRIWYEIALMKMIDHPNIVRIFEHFEDMFCVYMIVELAKGGDLYDHLVNQGRLDEQEAAHVLFQIFRGVQYMHSSQICHRDLKPENLLLVQEGEIIFSTIKICDLGNATIFAAGTLMTTKVGNLYYVSPQIVAGAYDCSCDLWTCGVVLYACLCGYPPFVGDCDPEILNKVRRGHYTMPVGDWQHIDPLCRQLVHGLLCMNPAKRVTARQALQSSWLLDSIPHRRGRLSVAIIDNIRRYRGYGVFKRACIHLIAVQVEDSVTRFYKDIFEGLDSTSDGLVSHQELRNGLQRDGVPVPNDLEEVLTDIDPDGTGELDFTEFLAATMPPEIYTKDDICWMAFRFFDLEADGIIDVSELRTALNNGAAIGEEVADEEMCEDMIMEVDEIGDHVISFDEFCKMMLGTTVPYYNVSQKEQAKRERRAHKAKGKYFAAQCAVEALAKKEPAKTSKSSDTKTRKKGVVGGFMAGLMDGMSRGKSFFLHQTGQHDDDKKSGKKSSRGGLKSVLQDQRDTDRRQSGKDNGKNRLKKTTHKSRVGFGEDRMREELIEKREALAREKAEVAARFDRFVDLQVCINRGIIRRLTNRSPTLDLWCTCEVEGKPETVFHTPEVYDNRNPTWKHRGSILMFSSKDKLLFKVWDHHMAPALCSGNLVFQQVEHNYAGELPMQTRAGESLGFLDLEIKVVDVQAKAAVKLQARQRGIQGRRNFLQKKQMQKAVDGVRSSLAGSRQPLGVKGAARNTGFTDKVAGDNEKRSALAPPMGPTTTRGSTQSSVMEEIEKDDYSAEVSRDGSKDGGSGVQGRQG